MKIKSIFLKLVSWVAERKQPASQQQNSVTNVNIDKIEIHIGKH